MVKKAMLPTVVLIMFAVLVFAYDPPPGPIPSNIPFLYDTAIQPTPIGWAVVNAGAVYDGQGIAYEPEAEPVTVTIEVGPGNVIQATIISEYDDPNDPGTIDPNDPTKIIRCKVYEYAWQWQTQLTDAGLHYLKITVAEAADPGQKDERTFLVLVKADKPPVLGGCKNN